MGFGEKLPDHTSQTGKVVGDENEDPAKTSREKILKDLGPEFGVFGAFVNPVSQYMFVARDIYTYSGKENDLLDGSVLSAHLGVKGVNEDGKPIGWQGLREEGLEFFPDKLGEIVQGVFRERQF
jgi:hypothetical protein